jgi:hypothetical protein
MQGLHCRLKHRYLYHCRLAVLRPLLQLLLETDYQSSPSSATAPSVGGGLSEQADRFQVQSHTLSAQEAMCKVEYSFDILD